MLSGSITILASILPRKNKHLLSVLVLPSFCCEPYNFVKHKYVILRWVGSALHHKSTVSSLTFLRNNL